jgi:DNA-binding transcriptional LysR family regulator
VTLNQLKVFVLAVRLGSLRAAAQALGVSEPAVSQALTALRQSLGDPLLVREGSGMVLTPAGRRVVGLASQMVNLAVEAEAAVRHAHGSPELIRIVATATVGEAVVPALLQAYTHRTAVEATLGIGTVEELSALLTERLADVAIGPRLSGPAAVGITSEPLQRYRLAFVASRADPLTSNAPVSLARLREVDWLVDPSGTDPLSEVGHLLSHARVAESRIPHGPAADRRGSGAGPSAPGRPPVRSLRVLERQPAGSPAVRQGRTP